jgi:hypothetical protein
MTTLADVLQPLDGTIPSSLVAPASLAAIAATVRDLPSALTHHFGFECALGDAAPTADFALAINPQDGEDGLLGSAPLPAAYRAHPVWDRLRQFSALWVEPASPLHGNLRNLCLEFDLRDAGPSDVPVPSAFFAPWRGITRTDAVDQGLSAAWVLDSALRLLRGTPLPPAVVQAVSGCVRALPADAHIFQIGLMLARPVDAVRLCIRDLELADLPPYLARVGWPGPWNEADAALAPFATLATRTALHLDVGSAVYPRIGLECYVGPPSDGAWPPATTAFLDALVDAGLCVPAKRDGLLAWPGEQRVSAADVPPLPSIADKARLMSRTASTIYGREVNHVKLNFTPGRPLEAKAYVGVLLRWRLGKLGSAEPLTLGQADW